MNTFTPTIFRLVSPESDSDEALPSSQTLVQSCLSSQRSLSPSERALARQELKRNLARSTAEKEAENELKSKQENEPEEKPVTKKGQNKKRKLPPSPASTSPETRPKSPAAKKRAVKSGEEGKKTIVPYTAAEDGIIADYICENLKIPPLMKLLPGRSYGSVQSRARLIVRGKASKK